MRGIGPKWSAGLAILWGVVLPGPSTPTSPTSLSVLRESRCPTRQPSMTTSQSNDSHPMSTLGSVTRCLFSSQTPMSTQTVWPIYLKGRKRRGATLGWSIRLYLCFLHICAVCVSIWYLSLSRVEVVGWSTITKLLARCVRASST